MDRSRWSSMDKKEGETIRDYLTRRSTETNNAIKDAVRSHYLARYGIRHVHKELLQLCKTNNENFHYDFKVKKQIAPIPRCCLVISGYMNAGKSTLINELLEIPVNEEPISPEFHQPCTEKITLIQDDSALPIISHDLRSRSESRLALIEVASTPSKPMETDIKQDRQKCQEIASAFFDEYSSLADIAKILLDRNMGTASKGENLRKTLSRTFQENRKDLIVRISCNMDLLSTGLQVVDFPGYGDSTPVQSYLTSYMKAMNPTVCLCLLNKAVYKETDDTETIKTLKEIYQERCKTQLLIAISQVDQEEETIEETNKHDMGHYVKCVNIIKKNLDKFTRRENDDDLFVNREKYTVVYGHEECELDLLGISTITYQNVKAEIEKSESNQSEPSELQWLLVRNWFILKEHIAMAIRKHTAEYVSKEKEDFDKHINGITFKLRNFLNKASNRHRSSEQTVNNLEAWADSCQKCLEERVKETFQLWRPKPNDIKKEWDLEQENLNVKDMEYYKYNPCRPILTNLLNCNIGTKVKQLIILTTDHTVHFLTKNFFVRFKKHPYNEKYSKDISNLISCLQTISYTAYELPTSLNKALNVLTQFDDVERQMEDVMFLKFADFLNDQRKWMEHFERNCDENSEKGKTVISEFMQKYVDFLVIMCLPEVKHNLQNDMRKRIEDIFAPTKRVIKFKRDETASNRHEFKEHKEELHALIHRRILPFCSYLSMCLASLYWEFSSATDQSNVVTYKRRPAYSLINYARNLVEIKMLLDSFEEEKKRFFVPLSRWCYDRNQRTILVMKEGKYLKPLLECLRTKDTFPGCPQLEQRYKLGLDILQGVEAIHDKNFVIDDFSTENIFVTSDASCALIDLDTTRESPFARLRLSDSDFIPPIHLHPDRFTEVSNSQQVSDGLCKVFDIYSFSSILWFLIDGTGTKDNLPKVYLSATNNVELQNVLRQEKPSIPKGCDHQLFKLVTDGWNLTKEGHDRAIQSLVSVKRQFRECLLTLLGTCIL